MYAHGFQNTLVSRAGNNTLLDLIIVIIGKKICGDKLSKIIGLY